MRSAPSRNLPSPAPQRSLPSWLRRTIHGSDKGDADMGDAKPESSLRRCLYSSESLNGNDDWQAHASKTLGSSTNGCLRRSYGSSGALDTSLTSRPRAGSLCSEMDSSRHYASYDLDSSATGRSETSEASSKSFKTSPADKRAAPKPDAWRRQSTRSSNKPGDSDDEAPAFSDFETFTRVSKDSIDDFQTQRTQRRDAKDE
ncbi:hypothetical protein M885DRAFT_528825 [Pelagophyceae sp. CCMP2097]|nr:hypothetical protein M885DRAFT_528825 [Pelagophyceae sp. CCMP2097]